jgi:hypothetical protein
MLLIIIYDHQSYLKQRSPHTNVTFVVFQSPGGTLILNPQVCDSKAPNAEYSEFYIDMHMRSPDKFKPALEKLNCNHLCYAGPRW